MAAAGLAGATAAGLIERVRSKSRSRSKRRKGQDFDLLAHSSTHEKPLESGTLLASSVEGSHSGLDYALVEIEGSHRSTPGRLFFNNGIQYVTLSPTRVSDERPKDAKIVAITGSSGYLSGRLLGTPSFSRAPDQPSQELWTVKFDGKLEEGDCGSCVFDAGTGDLYGHVVAGNPVSGYAYIVPAYQIREDLLTRFGEDLQLYRPVTHAPYGQFFTHSDPWEVQNNRSQSEGPAWFSNHTTSDDWHEPVSSENQSLSTNDLEQRSRNTSPSSKNSTIIWYR
jgi:hypothetical protein